MYPSQADYYKCDRCKSIFRNCIELYAHSCQVIGNLNTQENNA